MTATATNPAVTGKLFARNQHIDPATVRLDAYGLALRNAMIRSEPMPSIQNFMLPQPPLSATKTPVSIKRTEPLIFVVLPVIFGLIVYGGVAVLIAHL